MSNSTSAIETVVTAIQALGSPIMGLVGMITNVISLYIFSTNKRKEYKSAVFYLSLLAIFDFYNSAYFAILEFSHHAMKFITNGRVYINLLIVNQYACKLMRFTKASSNAMSAWVLCLYSGERCLATCSPLKINQMVTTKTRLKGILVVGVISFAPNIICLTDFIIYEDKGFKKCYMDPTSQDVQAMVSLMQIALIMIIPGSLLAGFNIAICRALVKQTKMKRTLTSSKDTKMNPAEKKCILNLIGISVLYIAAYLPHAVLWTVYNTLEQIQYHAEEKMDIDWRTIHLCAKMTDTLVLVNFAFNWAIYCKSLSFYGEKMVKIFPCCAGRNKSDGLETSGGTASKVTD